MLADVEPRYPEARETLVPLRRWTEERTNLTPSRAEKVAFPGVREACDGADCAHAMYGVRRISRYRGTLLSSLRRVNG